MKNQTTKPKSTITHIVAACLVLAVLGPPAAELSRGGRPDPIDVTFTLSGMCGFDVGFHGKGLEKVMSLPGGNILVIGVGFNTYTNLSDPSKSVTLNVTGPAMVSTDENGNTVVQAHGNSQVWGPSFGIKSFIGNWTFVLDQNGNIIQDPTGTGTITDVCALIQ